jgi:hypothetical protein
MNRTIECSGHARGVPGSHDDRGPVGANDYEPGTIRVVIDGEYVIVTFTPKRTPREVYAYRRDESGVTAVGWRRPDGDIVPIPNGSEVLDLQVIAQDPQAQAVASYLIPAVNNLDN